MVGIRRNEAFFASESWKDVLGGLFFFNEICLFTYSLLTYLMLWYDAVLVALHKEDAIYIWNILPTEKKTSLHDELSPFKDGSNRSNKICLARPPIRIGSANAGSQVLCEWLATAIQIPKKWNYTSGNSTWDIHMSGFKHGYVDAILVHMYVSFSGRKRVCRSASGCGNLKKPGSTKIRPKDEAISKAVS